MYKVDALIVGTAPLLQNRFAPAEEKKLLEGATKKTGSVDWSGEWIGKMYTKGGYLVQPATHIEGALTKAAVLFQIKGRGKKTWKDTVRAYVYVAPVNIVHHLDGEPVKEPPHDLNGDSGHLSVSIMRVKVNRAAVARSRLMVDAGWELPFAIDVIDDQMRPEVLQQILEEAGRAIGIGDYRPRYGRFEVVKFEIS